MSLLGLIGQLRTAKLDKFANDSAVIDGFDEGVREWAEVGQGANLVSSLRRDTFIERHAVILDLDVPAYLVPSSTEGHSHLYIDVKCSREDYFNLLHALADCGVIEEGYARASEAKGATFLRLPWVKKEGAK